MYTCPKCLFTVADAAVAPPPNCPQCGAVLPTQDDGFGMPAADAGSSKTLFGMPPMQGGAGAPPPPPGAGAPPPPPPMGAGGGHNTLDLPAPARATGGHGDLELPTGGPDPLSLDLPAPAGHGASAPMELDLPAPAGPGASSPNDLDLPAPAPRGPQDDGFGMPGAFDLPAPAGGAAVGPALDDLDLPAPAEDLPAPADLLPAPAADLAPAEVEGLQLDLDNFGPAAPGGGPPPAPPAPPVNPMLDTQVPDVGTAADANANLVDAHDSTPLPGALPEKPAEATPSRPAGNPAAPRSLRPEDVINHRASPAPKQIQRFTPKTLAIGGGVLLLLVGGLGGAYMLGLFDEEQPVVERGTGLEKPASKPSGPAAERVAPILARFDEDTPQSYQQALSLMESQGDKLAQAEAALLLHYRYGPDPVLLGKARALLGGYEAEQASYVTRVFGLLELASGKGDAALAKLGGSDPRSALYRGWVALDAEDYKKALKEAETVLAARPESVAGALVRDIAKSKIEADGIDILRQATAAHAEHPQYVMQFSRVLLDQGLIAEAEKTAAYFEQASMPIPSFRAKTMRLRAEIASAQGVSAEALRLLSQAQEIDPGSLVTRVQRIEVLVSMGDLAAARSDTDILLRDNPQLLEAGILAAEVAVELGEGDLALERIAGLGPDAQNLASAKLAEARVYAMKAQVPEAQAAFAKVRELDPLDAEGTADEAMTLARLGMLDKALPIVDAQIDAVTKQDGPRADRSHAALLLAKATLLKKQGGQDALVKETLERAVDIDSGNNDARLALAKHHLATGQRELAESTFMSLAERTGTYPGLTGPLGRIYLRRGDLEKLEALIGARLSDDGASDEILLTGAMLRLSQNKHEDALALVDRVLARSPASWEGHLARGRVLFAKGEYGAALIELEQARPTEPNATVELWLGRTLEMTGDEKKATMHFERAYEIEPANPEAAAYLARRLAYIGQARKAIEILEPVLSNNEDFPFAFAVAGRAYYDSGNRKRALEFLRKARRLEAGNFEAAYWEGRIEGDSNHHAAAAKALAHAVKVAPDTGRDAQDALRRLGRAYVALGRKGAAKDAFTRYLEIAPPEASGRAEAQRLLRDL